MYITQGYIIKLIYPGMIYSLLNEAQVFVPDASVSIIINARDMYYILHL